MRRWSSTRRVVLATSVVASSSLAVLALGLVATRSDSPKLTAILLTAALFAWCLVKRPGVALGLLVLGVQNGLPFLNTATTYIHRYALDDYVAVTLVVLMACPCLLGLPHPTQAARRLALVGACLVVWWVVVVTRSNGEPVSAAVSTGRNFLLFALLLVFFSVALTRRRTIVDALATICVGALLYSVAQTAVTVTANPLTTLIHPVATITSDVGLERVYAFMSDSAVLLWCLAVGAALLANKRLVRRLGVAGALISSVGIILQQTRAVYLTLPLALLLTLGAALIWVPTARTRLTRRAIGGVIGTALLIAVLSAAAPHLVATYGAKPLSRLSTVGTEFSSATGNIGYRINLGNTLLALLGGNGWHWLAGLGFLDPKYHYFAGLPLGSLRNSDVGLVDALVQVGIIGVGLIYLAVALPLHRMALVARAWRDRPPDSAWLFFGLFCWLIQVLIASYTLQTLWQEQGQVLVALVAGSALGLAVQDPVALAVRSPQPQLHGLPTRPSALRDNSFPPKGDLAGT